MSFLTRVLLILCSLNSGDSHCQKIKIPLIDRIGFNFIPQEILSGEKVRDNSLYKGIDSTKYKEYTVKKIVFYKLQEEVNDMVSTNVPEDKAKRWLLKYADTAYIQYRQMRENHAAFLNGVDHKGQIHFIMDANNNQRFDDDKHFIFDTSNSKKTYPVVYVNYKYYDGRHLKQISVPYRVDAYAYLQPIVYSYGNRRDTLRSTRLNFYSYKEGIYQLGKNKYMFNLVSPHMFVYKKDSFDISVQSTTSNRQIKGNPFIYKSTQLLEFNNALYRIDSLRDNILYMHLVERLKYGSTAGSTAPPIEGTDIMNNNYFSLREKRDSYVLINFWGSWCYPCIKELPILKNLQKKYKNISFLSIAADKPEDTVKLKTLIREKNLPWIHLWVNRSIIDRGVLWDYKINAFPTTILIDPSGKIILRGEGRNVLDQIDSIMSSN